MSDSSAAPSRSRTKTTARNAPRDRVLEACASTTDGLGTDDAQRRLDEAGPNRRRKIEHRSGDLVTADLRLLDTDRFQIDGSALIGESVPVPKKAVPVAPDTPLAERSCRAYKGTAVAKGRGLGLGVGTGMDTELGAISAMVETAEAASIFPSS